MFGDLGGDFSKATYEPKMFGMHIRSFLIGLRAENVNTDPKMSILPMCRVGNVSLEGTFVRIHMRQACLGCILEVL